MRIWLVAGAIMLWANTALHAQVLSDFKYLGEAVNQLESAWLKGPDLSIDEFQTATTSACTALNRIADNISVETRLFDDTLRDTQINETLGNLDALGVFLQFERDVLIEMGISATAASQLVAMAAALEEQAREENFNPDLILERLNTVRESVCTASAQAREITSSGSRWALAGRILRGVGGTALVIGNMAASAPSAGISAASMTFGGVLAGSAF